MTGRQGEKKPKSKQKKKTGTSFSDPDFHERGAEALFILCVAESSD